MRGIGWGVAAALVASASPAIAATPQARIDAYDGAIVAIMKAKLPMAARVERFTAVVSQYYDMPAIAALVIGPGWSSAAAADRAALIQALTRHSAISLAKNFKSFGGETFTVDPAVQTRGDATLVKVTISSGSSRDLLYFRLHQAKGDWAIVDVISGGVSQLAVQRADLAATAASGGAAAVAKRLAQIDAKSMGGA